MTLVLGMTGGIGSGKSTAAACFMALGVPVFNADQAARQAVAPHTDALYQIARYFGKDLITPESALDRTKLRNIVFSDPQAKQWLENLIHPLVMDLIKDWLAKWHQANQSTYAIIESPLLLETDQHQLVDRILVVDADPTQQIARASKRDKQTQAQIKAIIDAQMPRQVRLEKADYVIDNKGDLVLLKQQIQILHKKILASL